MFKRLRKHIKKLWKNDPLGLMRLFLEVTVVIGLGTFFMIRQTAISERLLEIEEKEQENVTLQNKIFEYEHSPRFQIVEYVSQKDSSGFCITKSIQIQNNGYAINEKKIEIFSYLQIKNESELETILPIKDYYTTGAITQEETGALEEYLRSHNCKNIASLIDGVRRNPEAYLWDFDVFHVVKIDWVDVLDQNHTYYFSTLKNQPYERLDLKEAKRLLELHKNSFMIDSYEKKDSAKLFREANSTFNL